MDEPKIVEVLDRLLVATRLSMSLSNNQTRALWQGFRPRIKEVANREGTDFYSIQHLPEGVTWETFSPKTEFVKLAAIEVAKQENIPNGMEAYTLKGGKYAVFIHHGPASAFAKTFQFIFGQWLPNSTFVVDKRDQFEVLSGSYRPDDPNAQEEVWIPIKSKEGGFQ